MIYHLVIVILVLVGCMSCSSHSIQDTKAGREVTSKIKRFCKTEDGLVFSRWEHNMFAVMISDEIVLDFEFTVYRRVDMEEARRLCIRCAEEIQNILSSFDEFRPYIEAYPFPPYNFSMGILFSEPERPEGFHPVRDGMDSVGIAHGYIYYTKYEEELKAPKGFYKESCLSARRLVRPQDARAD